MSSILCITVRFLQPYSHGRGDDSGPEWPPSPLRLIQALVAASAGRWNERSMLQHAASAIRWLETLPPPRIVAATALAASQPYRLYVPDNVADKVAASWSKGREASIADYRTEKDVLPSVIDGEAVHFLYYLPADSSWRDDVNTITLAARSITHLGWGIDMAVGDASVISVENTAKLEGVRWRPSPTGGTPLRVPRQGTLDDLSRRHTDFLNRVTDEGFRPVPPLRVFDIVRYRSQNEPAHRPYRLFELRNLDGGPFRYPHARLIHIAGMVRHLAIEAMKDRRNRPEGAGDDWVETYIAGHRKGRKVDQERERKCDGDLAAAQRHIDGKPDACDLQHDEAFKDTHVHQQLSYLPLPSVGHRHTDPGVRRVMIAAPIGDDALLDHVCRRLAGQQLKALNEKSPEFRRDEHGRSRPGPILVPMPLRGDGVTRCYTTAASERHSFTPVILPGHDDHKPGKTRELIEKALRQAGIEQPCEFEWSPISRFAKSYTAHKYDRQKRPQGYIRPRYLLSQTAVHLTLRFHDGSAQQRPVQVPGPIVIGAGRHCGLGVLATINA